MRYILLIAMLVGSSWGATRGWGEILTGNILPNADVEVGRNGSPVCWHRAQTVQRGGFSDWSMAQSVSSIHALRLYDRDSSRGMGAIWRSDGLKAPRPSQDLRFEWNWKYHNVSGAGILIAVRFFNGPVDAGKNTSGAFLEQFGKIAQGSHGAWERTGVSFTVPAGARSMDVVMFSVNDAVQGELFCDDLCVAPLSVVSLESTVLPTALRDMRDGPVTISGSVNSPLNKKVKLRVTTSAGISATIQVEATSGAFSARYPNDFPGASAFQPGTLMIDATVDADFIRERQAEAMVLVYDSRTRQIPDLPTAFTNDLLDKRGRTDRQCKEWPTIRALMNLYFQSRGAQLAGIVQPAFDLTLPGDLQSYKNNFACFEFDWRDRDWSTPLGHRLRRTFWQSVWNTWFISSNDNPLDGNPSNQSPRNYRPYAFANDYADILIMYLLRQHDVKPLDDNLQTMCREGTENLLAMQHKEASNFSLKDSHGKQHVYTAGAFRYGMFENGEFMTEGTGWFYNPASNDYYDGGVLNGRATWGLGVALAEDPQGPLAGQIKEALKRSVKFCLHDALASGYAKRSPRGNVYWRDAGEHAYLLIGLLNACTVAPGLMVLNPDADSSLTLRQVCASSLDALVDLKSGATNRWSVYPNTDAMAITALADGAMILADHPHAVTWRKIACEVADTWLAARPDPAEFPGRVIHFSPFLDRGMTYNWSHLSATVWQNHNYIFYYVTGHWIQALTRLYALTHQARYSERVEAMIGYLCGANRWGVRLLSETGGIYNWVEDTDGDGLEDQLKFDMYPESTSFNQIGIIYYLRERAAQASFKK